MTVPVVVKIRVSVQWRSKGRYKEVKGNRFETQKVFYYLHETDLKFIVMRQNHSQ